MKNRIIQVVILFIGVFAFAQQDPHYTQYMYNMSVMNCNLIKKQPFYKVFNLLYHPKKTQIVCVLVFVKQNLCQINLKNIRKNKYYYI